MMAIAWQSQQMMSLHLNKRNYMSFEKKGWLGR